MLNNKDILVIINSLTGFQYSLDLFDSIVFLCIAWEYEILALSELVIWYFYIRETIIQSCEKAYCQNVLLTKYDAFHA
ncbi:hypothetical protein V1477_014619 [Vespula maculifrons]|uniref:Uncharacterized protein n=1 Tax=Vespula maculifrons TaxID=7453 RepID=A0ABD2BIY3_VESMC